MCFSLIKKLQLRQNFLSMTAKGFRTYTVALTPVCNPTALQGIFMIFKSKIVILVNRSYVMWILLSAKYELMLGETFTIIVINKNSATINL